LFTVLDKKESSTGSTDKALHDINECTLEGATALRDEATARKHEFSQHSQQEKTNFDKHVENKTVQQQLSLERKASSLENQLKLSTDDAVHDISEYSVEVATALRDEATAKKNDISQHSQQEKTNFDKHVENKTVQQEMSLDRKASLLKNQLQKSKDDAQHDIKECGVEEAKALRDEATARKKELGQHSQQEKTNFDKHIKNKTDEQECSLDRKASSLKKQLESLQGNSSGMLIEKCPFLKQNFISITFP